MPDEAPQQEEAEENAPSPGDTAPVVETSVSAKGPVKVTTGPGVAAGDDAGLKITSVKGEGAEVAPKGDGAFEIKIKIPGGAPPAPAKAEGEPSSAREGGQPTAPAEPPPEAEPTETPPAETPAPQTEEGPSETPTEKQPPPQPDGTAPAEPEAEPSAPAGQPPAPTEEQPTPPPSEKQPPAPTEGQPPSSQQPPEKREGEEKKEKEGEKGEKEAGPQPPATEPPKAPPPPTPAEGKPPQAVPPGAQKSAAANLTADKAAQRKGGGDKGKQEGGKQSLRDRLNPIRRAKEGARRRVNEAAAPAMALLNWRKIKALEKKIRQEEKGKKPLEKDIKKLESKISLAKRAARIADALITIGKYLAVMVELWWWTIIGALVDILIVLPTIAIAYYTGLTERLGIKGEATKAAEKTLKPLEEEKEKKKGQLKEDEKKIQDLYRQKVELTQLIPGDDKAQPNQPQAPEGETAPEEPETEESPKTEAEQEAA